MGWIADFFGFSKPKRELFIVVYDTESKTLSTPHFRKVQEAFARQKGFKTLIEHVRSLLCLPKDKETVIQDILDFRKVANGNIERHYILVVGRKFMFKEHLERDFFQAKPDVVAAKFGPAAPHIIDMFEHLPDQVLVRA